MSNPRKRLLLVDDDPHDRELATRWLEKELTDLSVVPVSDAIEFARALRGEEPEAVIAAAEMDWGDGIGVLEATREAGFHCPVILLGDESQHEQVVSAMRKGASDYLLRTSRGWLELPSAVRRAVQSRRDDSGQESKADSRAIADLEAANEELAQFAYVASHELREPLRVVEKHAELLAMDARENLEPQDLESLEFIQSSAQRMQALIIDMLEYYRVSGETQHRALCDLEAVVRKVVEELQPSLQEVGAEVTVEDLPRVHADSGQIRHVLRNLISNAVKFRGESTPRIRLMSEKGEGEWIVSVADNGIGMEPDEAATIFQMFQRLHPEIPGTGIGLALCRRIIESHGGRIWVRSRPGEGSVFQFALPEPKATTDRKKSRVRSKSR